MQKDTKKILRKIEDVSDNHIKKSFKINFYLIYLRLFIYLNWLVISTILF